MRILIINSDSPRNRGDRAILAGLIAGIRAEWPRAEIASLSQYAQRDSAWFGIRFLPQSPYSTSLRDYCRLLREARSSDLILWGGGELLKDYTNIVGVAYWGLKIVGVSLINRNVYGAFQGIGPVSSPLARQMIIRTVNRTRGFVTRDEESLTKLVAWGVKVPVFPSFDPAVIAPIAPWTPGLASRVSQTLEAPEDFLERSIGIGIRKWFHYRKGRVLPHRLMPAPPLVDFLTYQANISAMADRVIERHDVNVVFSPMHMSASEGDSLFANAIIGKMKHGRRARVLSEDTFSPAELSCIIGRLRCFIAFRLHSAILASCAGVPTLLFYYVDKGRVFFHQLGISDWARPAEDLLVETFLQQEAPMLDRLVLMEYPTVKVERRIADMREHIIARSMSWFRSDGCSRE